MATLLSVILPTHDRADDLQRAAASVLAQDIRDLELVVVDDASADSTPEILERMATQDRRLRVVRSDSQLGPCEARNLALATATGDLVGFCDDDDVWLPGAARTLLDYLDGHPDTGAVSSWHDVSHSELGKTVSFRGPLRYGSRHLLWQNFVALPFGIIRRSALSFDVRFDPALPTGEDWDLWLRCAQERPICTLPKVCYVYTQHRRSRVTRTAAAQIEGRQNFLDKHRAAMPPACRLYHQTVIAGYEHGRSAMMRTLASVEGFSPRDRGFVSLVLACSQAASRVGQHRRDPGLQARLMASMVGGRRRGRRRPG